MAAVYGAVSMNNTLNVGIFFLLLYVRGLLWDYTANIVPMIVVILAVGIFAAFRDTFKLFHGMLVFLLYPLSIGMVVLLQAVIPTQYTDKPTPSFHASSSAGNL